ncbi:spore germination protein [Oceanirhabdus sp. W0125-5]|uniref:spore germination protein n=1 Tax=Oceanirhabdus sp. W0125-5 TaxID=2999116 RepID=UPI0022F318F9|nr:spore germination protein [Oceanirhabdus sp. W0125-5]WBW98462.1 spore germination protein [Oceanirhabdus sp. W0125-5]
MKEELRDDISFELDENLKYIKDTLVDNYDFVYREFYADKWKVALIYIDGMSDKVVLNDYVMEPLMLAYRNKLEHQGELISKVLSLTDLRPVDKLKDGINASLAGECLLLIDGMDKIYVLATRAWPARGVSEPSGETVIRGAREGFTETIRFNTALVRRRIRDTRYRAKPKMIGTRSKTDIAILYIEDIADKELVTEVEKRLDEIEIDAIQDSGYIEQMIEDNKLSPFPQVQSTERPDVVASAIYEGRVAILVDNSPFALIVPGTLPALFQSPDDYNQRWMHSSLIRLLRVFAMIAALVAPALYIATTAFHTNILPTKLAYSIAASREGVPFPAFVEALIMEISMALLIEAMLKLPKAIGSTIGVVGGLVVGQAAVSAGIVSPIMIIIVGLTAITTFLTPNHGVVLAFRGIRIVLIILASVLGLYGIAIGMIIVLIHLLKLTSFGTPYLAPFVYPARSELKDMIMKYPLRSFIKRPAFLHPNDKIRQKK